jgi:hypothetical protein
VSIKKAAKNWIEKILVLAMKAAEKNKKIPFSKIL